MPRQGTRTMTVTFTIPRDLREKMKMLTCNWSATLSRCVSDVLAGKIEPVPFTPRGKKAIMPLLKKIEELEKENETLRNKNA